MGRLFGRRILLRQKHHEERRTFALRKLEQYLKGRFSKISIFASLAMETTKRYAFGRGFQFLSIGIRQFVLLSNGQRELTIREETVPLFSVYTKCGTTIDSTNRFLRKLRTLIRNMYLIRMWNSDQLNEKKKIWLLYFVDY